MNRSTRQRKPFVASDSRVLAAAPKEDWGQLGPAMRALPNEQWRSFVYAYISGKPGLGAQTNAARLAGFGKNAANIRKIAWKLAHDDRMIAAIAEESRKIIRVDAPEAARALMSLIRNPRHRDHARAIGMMLERTDPAVSQHNVAVLHKIVDPDHEALEELRAMRAVNATREKLLEYFGHNGLERLEALEAADTNRRAAQAKMIDGDVIEEQAAYDR